MVAIRLSRVGKKNHPTFRVVVSDKRKDTIGTALEILGSYDPHASPMKLELDAERVKYWLSVGAQPSDTVHNLLIEKGLLSGQKRKIVNAPAKAAEPVVAEAAAAATPAKEAPSAPAETAPAAVEPAPTEQKA